MNLQSVSSRNTVDRTAQLVRQRLQGMEDQVFVQLNGNNTFEQVSQSVDGWTPGELETAVGRAPKLASDPAKGNKITDGSIEEAAVALTAEHQKIFTSATRESSGSAEFIDNLGIAWDVKSPLSPPEGQNWNFLRRTINSPRFATTSLKGIKFSSISVGSTTRIATTLAAFQPRAHAQRARPDRHFN